MVILRATETVNTMHSENYEVISDGSVNLYCRCFEPDQTPIAVMVIVHGLGEHSGRYDEMAEEFLRQNIAVFSFDHRGHGKSGGKKGHAKSIDQLVEDTEHVLMQCRSLFLDLPLILYGHSMGGQVVATYLSRKQSKEISCAIISSAWFSLTNPPASWLVGLSGLLNAVIPSLTLENGLNPQYISSVPSEVEAYTGDILVHKKISASLFYSLYQNGQNLLKYCPSAGLPILVCHGENDYITSLEGSTQFARKLGEKALFHSWPNSRHEPHHDVDKAKVIGYYVQWVKKQVAGFSDLH